MLVKFFDIVLDADKKGNVWIDLENAVEVYGPMNHHGYCLKVYAKQLKDGKWIFSEDMLDHKKPSGTKIRATRWALNDADIRSYLRTLQSETCRSYDHNYTHFISLTGKEKDTEDVEITQEQLEDITVGYDWLGRNLFLKPIDVCAYNTYINEGGKPSQYFSDVKPENIQEYEHKMEVATSIYAKHIPLVLGISR